MFVEIVGCDDEKDFVADSWYADVPNDYTGLAIACGGWDAQGTCAFNQGKQHGIEKSWHSNGQLIYEKNWSEGKLVDKSVVYYNEDGSVDRIEYFKDGQMIDCKGDCA